jgi:hypothetical protein
MADGNAQILRQLGNNWLECADEQGIFYFNQVTQQSSDTLPAELMPVASMPTAASHRPPMKAKVLSGGIGSLPQGVAASASYTPPQVVSASYTPPQVAYQQQQMMQPMVQKPVSSYTPAVQQVQHPVNCYAQQAPQPVSSYTPAVQQVQMQPPMPQQFVGAAPTMAATPQQPATQKMAFGDWAVYQDELGMFYMQVSTGMQFESPPPELNQAYQQYRAQQDQLHRQALQQIEMQKQQIDSQLQQQTESLKITYGFGAGAPLTA